MKNPRFLTSAASKAQFLGAEKPIIAVCGKSNVGKSSFINMLAGNRRLARVSKEPGRTRLVNYFDFGEFVLADLPGYGFARVAKAEKDRWARLMEDFFAQSEGILHVFALADIRHDPTADDRQMIEYLTYFAIPFTVVATKADKLSRAAKMKSRRNIAAIYGCGEGDIVCTSAETGEGKDEVFKIINRRIAAGRGES